MRPAVLVATAILLVPAGEAIAALELKPDTLRAYERYVTLTEARMARELSGESAFLWVDRQPEVERKEHLAALRRGEVVVAPVETRDGEREVDVSDGQVHHWVGTVLIPGATLSETMAFVQDYARYPDHFAPLILQASVRNRTGNRFDVRMRTSMSKMMVTVVLDADYAVEYRTVAPGRVFTRSVATNIAQIHDPGESGERSEPADKGPGWLWRIATWCSFEERPEGTYEQCESASLTRSVPFAVAWIVKPFVTSIPRESMAFTLGQVRAGIASR